jgi:hypothetical protein
MMFKIRQGLTLQQCLKHPGLFRRSLHRHQVLNLTEDYHPLDPLLLSSILEDSKLSGLLGGWFIWIHEKLKFDPLQFVFIRPINLVHLLHLGNKRNGVLARKSRQSSGRFENLLIAIFWIEILQQKRDHSALC